MAARHEGEAEHDDRQELDVGAARPEVEGDQRTDKDRGDHHEATWRRDRQDHDGEQAQQGERHQHHAVIEGQVQGARDQPEWHADQHGQGEIRQVMQRRVGTRGEIPRELGHRCAGPVDAVDGLPAEESVDRRLDLEQPVMLHREAKARPLGHGVEGRSDRRERAQRRDRTELEPPALLDQGEGQEQGDETRRADGGHPYPHVCT